MRIAAAAYAMDPLTSWEAYEAKLTRWIAEATDGGADLAVFPEYGAMELAAISGQAGDLEASLHAVSACLPQVDDLHRSLARRFDLHILAASAPVFDPAFHPTRPVNRARLFAPSGAVGVQDKQIMTRFEREVWDVHPGGPLRVFDTALGSVAILICYDAEFPLLARAVVAAEAKILLVPSCTDTTAGYWRVRIGAMARALEGQCIVVQAPTVGDCDWSPAVDENRGAAGVFGPPDVGFPQTGCLAIGDMDAPGWVFADVDLTAVDAVRQAGAVRGLAHWDEQKARTQRCEQVPLI